VASVEEPNEQLGLVEPRVRAHGEERVTGLFAAGASPQCNSRSCGCDTHLCDGGPAHEGRQRQADVRGVEPVELRIQRTDAAACVDGEDRGDGELRVRLQRVDRFLQHGRLEHVSVFQQQHVLRVRGLGRSTDERAVSGRRHLAAAACVRLVKPVDDRTAAGRVEHLHARVKAWQVPNEVGPAHHNPREGAPRLQARAGAVLKSGRDEHRRSPLRPAPPRRAPHPPVGTRW
jgi:hypothetical protein